MSVCGQGVLDRGVALRLAPQSKKIAASSALRGCLWTTFLALALGDLSVSAAPAPAPRAPSSPPVTVTEDRSAYTLGNGVVTARVHKLTGDLLSLKYKGQELMGAGSGHPFGYWSHAPVRGMRLTNFVSIHPKQNGGERAEVSVKGFYSGGEAGPRGVGSGVTACDIEIRYTLARGDSGVYTCSIFTHPAHYPGTSVGEARFGVKLNRAVFDYMTIDEKRRKVMPTPEDWDQGTQLNMKEARRLNTGRYAGQVEHKYDYSAIQFDIPAFGWSSTKYQLGFWFVNPSMEYLSGGPTKVELTGHLDNNEGGAPTLLNYWRGSHYGGSVCVIGDGEAWSKVIGPFLIYCNSAAGHEAMWKDALARAAAEARAWPYDWVRLEDYPLRNERGKVEGQIVLNDPHAPDRKWSGLLVGLAAPDYITPALDRNSGEDEDEAGASEGQGRESPARAEARSAAGSTNQAARSRGGAGGGGEPEAPRLVDWQLDAKFYQFWVRGDERGRFTIPKVRPGRYTLHVIADGVLGEAAKSNIVVRSGRTLDLGKLQWTPARHGRPLWEIGVADRSAAEFRHGDHYWQWGLYNLYTNEFPDDVNFVIGSSDYRTDWNYVQVPRSTRRGTTWSVTFNLAETPRGTATLRLGIAGVSLRGGIQVSVNDQPAGTTAPLADTATIRRDGIRGYWSERNVSFDASLMRAGTNVLKLTIPRGGPMTGVEYDYLRMELDEPAAIAAGEPQAER